MYLRRSFLRSVLKKNSSESVTKRAFHCCLRFLFSMNDAVNVIRWILQLAPADRQLAARRRLQITIPSLREPPFGCEVESHITNDKKDFYVACSKNGFLPWTMENDQRQLLAQFRSTSNSGISSGALLVVLQDICFPPRTSTYTYSYTCTSMYSYTYVCTSIHMYYLCVLTYSFMCIHAFLHVMHMH